MTTPDVADAMVATIERPSQEWNVLDPACGDGNLLLAVARHLAARGIQGIQRRIAGVDIDPVMVACARERLSEQIGCPPAEIRLWARDFLLPSGPDAHAPLPCADFNVVVSNPPYGKLREYRFFETANESLANGTELVFLVPLAFLDRVEGIERTPLKGRPLGVTTGHAIVHHHVGNPFTIRPVRAFRSNGSPFSVLCGAKLYEVGSGTPPQTTAVTQTKPFSSDKQRLGWMPCLRTGDVHSYEIGTPRLWVDYGPHIAHPKDPERFAGPRVLVRRVPIWSPRRLGAAYLEEPMLCTGDLLIVQHEAGDVSQLRGLCVFLNSTETADFVLAARPSVQLRDSYPKISAKDLHRLFEARLPDADALAALARQYGRV
jgi:SAM-dependent methyltransferase